MSLEENKVIIRRLMEAANKQDLASYDDLVAPDYVDHTRQLRGLEDLKQFVTMVYKSFPDWHAS